MTTTDPFTNLMDAVERTWGFRNLRPLQEQAMRAVLAGRDSLVVMPTGGGKSLCYQGPALARGGTTVVVSPLISLMKDQVDGLQECGVAAAQLDSSQSAADRMRYENALIAGSIRLLFVSPERLAQDSFRRLLKQAMVHTFAVDEAHCISHWGHDFRKDYRQLQNLRVHFPEASLHAYTATATPQVRKDIVAQLGLKDPEILVGDFDRPNLTYRVVQRENTVSQVLDILARHKNEAGIIYCIRRKDVDDLYEELRTKGFSPLPYHAGLLPEQRESTQDAFLNERCNLIVATVAFGMGIDRSNIRFVIHTGMPKSVEHYQQEAGRAGRDGLPSECVLLTSGADHRLWKRIVEKSAEEFDAQPEFLQAAISHLDDIHRYCRAATCRHRMLVEYFGQSSAASNCKACDICLGELDTEPESTVIAQKILSCVARVKESFGVRHVVSLLRGEKDERIVRLKHNELTTFGLLSNSTRVQIRDWIMQLVSVKLLDQTSEDYPVLKLTPGAWEVLRGKRGVMLTRAAKKKRRRDQRIKIESAEISRDQALFHQLRDLRRRIATEIRKPPYIIFDDRTLQEMARTQPSTPEEMRRLPGIGAMKMESYGERFLAEIRTFLGR